MTDEQIIKELECRIDNFSKSVLDLINRQKAEILELQKRIINWRSDMDYRPEQIKSEAIKEFAERLKESTNYICDNHDRTTMIIVIDTLVKTMTKGS